MDPVLGRPQRHDRRTWEHQKYLAHILARLKSHSLAVTLQVFDAFFFVANYEAKSRVTPDPPCEPEKVKIPLKSQERAAT